MVRRVIAFVVCATLFGWSEVAGAQTRRLLDLDYQVPPPCPSAVDFESDVRAVLKSSTSKSAEISVRIRVSREEENFVLQMRLPTGHRKLVGSSCEDVTEAAALVVALLLEDPAFQLESPPKKSQPAPVDESPRSHDPPGVSWAFDLGGGIDVGTLQVEAPLAYLAAGATIGQVGWSIRVDYAGLPSQRLDELRTLRMSTARGGLDVCILPIEGSRLAFGACAGIFGGVLFVSGEGIGEPDSGTIFLLQAQIGPRAWWRLTRQVGLLIDLDYLAPLVRPSVTFVGPTRPQEVHRVGAGLAATLGLRLSL